jgi:lipoprotein-anchoring transpeptidase ErfK/SrfK
MKTALFSIIFSVLTIFSAAKANATEADFQRINSSDEITGELGDYMSPDAIAHEFSREPHQNTAIAFRGAYTNRLMIIVDKARQGTSPTAQTVQVNLDGRMIYNWYVSTGRETPEHPKSGSDYVSSTPTGNFRIERMDINHYSKTWEAPMPFALFFTGGIALHATVPSHIPDLGKRASGGCVRLHPVNAEQLWNLVHQIGVNNVLITVHNG